MIPSTIPFSEHEKGNVNLFFPRGLNTQNHVNGSILWPICRLLQGNFALCADIWTSPTCRDVTLWTVWWRGQRHLCPSKDFSMSQRSGWLIHNRRKKNPPLVLRGQKPWAFIPHLYKSQCHLHHLSGSTRWGPACPGCWFCRDLLPRQRKGISSEPAGGRGSWGWGCVCVHRLWTYFVSMMNWSSLYLCRAVNLLNKKWLWTQDQCPRHFWPFSQYKVILKIVILLIPQKKNCLYFTQCQDFWGRAFKKHFFNVCHKWEYFHGPNHPAVLVQMFPMCSGRFHIAFP